MILLHQKPATTVLSFNASLLIKIKVGQILSNINILCKWLEPDAEIYSIFEIYSKMIELVGKNDNVYAKRWLKTKLKIKYE